MSELSLKVRQAKAEDAAALAEIAEQTFRTTFGTENNQSDLELHCAQNFGFDIQLKEILDPNVITILADVDDRLAGYAQIRLYSPQPCISSEHPSEIHRIYISKDYHGLGIAQELMGDIISRAKTTYSDWIWLGVWEHNPRAIAFYKKCHFEVVGEHTFLFGSDPQRDLVMALPLC